MITVKVPGPSEVPLEFIVANGGVEIQVMAEICLGVLDGFGMPVEWALSIVFPMFKGMGDISKYSCYSAVKLLEHEIKVLEMVLKEKP